MRRRDFIKLIAGSAASWPLTAGAQQAGKLPTIGFLGAAKRSAYSQWDAAFVQRLRELGWIEGRTITIEYRWAEGRSERYAEIANEFVQLKVNVIVTWGTAAVVAAKRATMEIPIVFAATGDPVGTGLVAKLARPGGNVTGLSNQLPDGAGKRIGLFREIVPDLRRLAIMTNIGSPIGALEMSEAQAAAYKPSRRSGVTLRHFMLSPNRSQALTWFALTLWRWDCDCRRCMACASMPKREA